MNVWYVLWRVVMLAEYASCSCLIILKCNKNRIVWSSLISGEIGTSLLWSVCSAELLPWTSDTRFTNRQFLSGLRFWHFLANLFNLGPVKPFSGCFYLGPFEPFSLFTALFIDLLSSIRQQGLQIYWSSVFTNQFTKL